MTAAQQKRKGQREKPPKSCQECRMRKTKCGRERPVCHACKARRTSERCLYDERVQLARQQNIQQLRVRISALQTQLQQLEQADAALTHAHTQDGKPARTYTPRPAVKREEGASPRRPAGGAPSPPHAGAHAGPASRMRPDTGERSMYELPYIGHTIPVYASSPLLMMNFNYRYPFDPPTNPSNLDNVLPLLPSFEYFERQVRGQFVFASRLCGITDFDILWDSFPSESLKAASDSADMGNNLGLVFAVLALSGIMAKMERESVEEDMTRVRAYCAASLECLRFASFLRLPNRTNIRAVLIICYYLVNSCQLGDAWALSGCLIRQVVALGLHRHHKYVNPDMSEENVRRGRELWSAVLYLDSLLSFIFNRSCGIYQFDVPEPDNLSTRLMYRMAVAINAIQGDTFRSRNESTQYEQEQRHALILQRHQHLEELYRQMADVEDHISPFFSLSLQHYVSSAVLMLYLPEVYESLQIRKSSVGACVQPLLHSEHAAIMAALDSIRMFGKFVETFHTYSFRWYVSLYRVINSCLLLLDFIAAMRTAQGVRPLPQELQTLVEQANAAVSQVRAQFIEFGGTNEIAERGYQLLSMHMRTAMPCSAPGNGSLRPSLRPDTGGSRPEGPAATWPLADAMQIDPYGMFG